MSEEHLKISCPDCESTKNRKAGKYQTRKGYRQRYQCKVCALTFSLPIKEEVK